MTNQTPPVPDLRNPRRRNHETKKDNELEVRVLVHSELRPGRGASLRRTALSGGLQRGDLKTPRRHRQAHQAGLSSRRGHLPRRSRQPALQAGQPRRIVRDLDQPALLLGICFFIPSASLPPLGRGRRGFIDAAKLRPVARRRVSVARKEGGEKREECGFRNHERISLQQATATRAMAHILCAVSR